MTWTDKPLVNAPTIAWDVNPALMADADGTSLASPFSVGDVELYGEGTVYVEANGRRRLSLTANAYSTVDTPGGVIPETIVAVVVGVAVDANLGTNLAATSWVVHEGSTAALRTLSCNGPGAASLEFDPAGMLVIAGVRNGDTVVGYVNSEVAWTGTTSDPHAPTPSSVPQGDVYRVFSIPAALTASQVAALTTELLALYSGNESTLTWAAPAFDGGAPITGYQLTFAGADGALVALQLGPDVLTATVSTSGGPIALSALNDFGASTPVEVG